MRKQAQFSKLMCVMSWLLMAASVFLDFGLRWSGRGQMSDVAMALISFETVFINGGYITQNVFRDVSLNKNGIHMPDGGDKHYIERNEENV
jgi:hypothetical protein